MVNGQSLLSLVDMLALGMIIIGAVVMPITRWRTWRLNMYLNAGVGGAFLAAIGTAGYSFIESVALQNMRAARWQPFTAGSTFVVLQSSTIVFWMIPILRWGVRESLEIPQKIPSVLVTGIFSVGTYLLVLVSMSLVEEVSYVVALRQLSIPIGVAIGVLWLGEKLTMSRMQGIMLMIIGLVLVAI
jgi:drug/metabolite transporter (DMT)-like permease